VPVVLRNKNMETGCYQYVNGIESFFKNRMFCISIHTTDSNVMQEKEIVDKLVNCGYKSIIILPSGDPSSLSDFYSCHILNGIKFHFLDWIPNNISADLVTSNNIMGGYEITKYLINNGHRNIIFLKNCINSLSTTQERLK
jgi:DNA-binding LacI/PurR family transcriptional regulator